MSFHPVRHPFSALGAGVSSLQARCGSAGALSFSTVLRPPPAGCTSWVGKSRYKCSTCDRLVYAQTQGIPGFPLPHTHVQASLCDAAGMPLLLMHGGCDRLAMASATQTFHDNASSVDKSCMIYDGCSSCTLRVFACPPGNPLSTGRVTRAGGRHHPMLT